MTATLPVSAQDLQITTAQHDEFDLLPVWLRQRKVSMRSYRVSRVFGIVCLVFGILMMTYTAGAFVYGASEIANGRHWPSFLVLMGPLILALALGKIYKKTSHWQFRTEVRQLRAELGAALFLGQPLELTEDFIREKAFEILSFGDHNDVERLQLFLLLSGFCELEEMPTRNI